MTTSHCTRIYIATNGSSYNLIRPSNCFPTLTDVSITKWIVEPRLVYVVVASKLNVMSMDANNVEKVLDRHSNAFTYVPLCPSQNQIFMGSEIVAANSELDDDLSLELDVSLSSD